MQYRVTEKITLGGRRLAIGTVLSDDEDMNGFFFVDADYAKALVEAAQLESVGRPEVAQNAGDIYVAGTWRPLGR